MAYKILWYSIPALHDNTNGAAIHSKIMLEALARRGIEIKVLNALVGDDVHGLEVFNRIAQVVGDTKERKFLQFTDNGIEYIVAKTKGHLTRDITNEDQNTIFDLYLQLLDKFQPDMVMGYSGDIFSSGLRREAKMRGMTVAYALHNGLHRGFSFIDCDLVFSPSEASAKMYREGDGTDVKAVGQFIDKSRILATKRDQPDSVKYVTLVNPTPEKGLAIFVKLYEAFVQKHPEIPFLVVKSVGDYASMVRSLHYKDGTPYVQNGQPCVAEGIKVAEHTDDPRLIYDISRVVVMPSVWHESWGCVATEAVMNGIPVLASKSGGLPEAVREGGILLDAPECTQKDYRCVPDDEEIAPWVEALERCLNEDWTERCQQASDYNDLERSIDRLMAYLEPLLQQGQQNKKPLDKSAYFTDLTMQKRKEAYAEAAKMQAEQQAQAQAQQAQASQEGQAVAADPNATPSTNAMQGNSTVSVTPAAQGMSLGATVEPLIDVEGYGKPKVVAAPVAVAPAKFTRVSVRNTVKATSNSSKKNRSTKQKRKK